MTEYERALHDPRAVFAEPKEVLADRDLSADQKYAILESCVPPAVGGTPDWSLRGQGHR